MSFQTVANISLFVEFVVISAIVLTLLNAVNHGRLFAAVARLGKPKPVHVKAVPHSAAIKHHKAPPMRRAA
jgi:hypothetical protein